MNCLRSHKLAPDGDCWCATCAATRAVFVADETVDGLGKALEQLRTMKAAFLAVASERDALGKACAVFKAKIRSLELREPTRDQMTAALGDSDETFFDGWTVRRCRVCRRPVAGGPTACVVCVAREEGRAKAQHCPECSSPMICCVGASPRCPGRTENDQPHTDVGAKPFTIEAEVIVRARPAPIATCSTCGGTGRLMDGGPPDHWAAPCPDCAKVNS